MARALPALIDRVREVLPERLREALQVTEIQTALRWLHFPENEQQAEQALRRFKIQELFVLQLAITMQRLQREQANVAPECEPSGKLHARIINRLGVNLTKGQQQAIAEVGRDMARSIPMNRLLQGDVGSGKTMVAQYAMLLAVAHDYQAVMMAPTEVLAIQHAETLRASLASSRVNVALLTGEVTGSQRTKLLADIADGRCDVIVGTQALLSAEVRFARLGLVIVDEQHKFGVRQRAELKQAGLDAHYLVMTATPIPRTVAISLFGDLDVSAIRKAPPGRQKVNTYVASDTQRDKWWKFFRDKLDEGRQGYVVTPLVEDGDDENLASAQQAFEELAAERLDAYRVDLIHGRMSGSDKELAMEEFRNGDTQVLVATSVVEVGVDVPNATLMTIENGERFGLAQLHQLRGRISRGTRPGYLCVFAAPDNDDAQKRLDAFSETTDGFELAEADFRFRGPGDVLGRKQSGMPPMRIADLTSDIEVLMVAREMAQEMVDEDPDLESPELADLRGQVLRRYGKRLELGDVA